MRPATKRSTPFTMLACLASILALTLAAQARPIVWVGPPADNGGQNLREMFAEPDEWARSRARIDVLGYADHNLAQQFSDAELRGMFAQIGRWNLKLGLEVGAIKPWGPTGAKAFAAGRLFWNRFIADGARIDTLAMDEPLSFSLNGLHQSSDYAVAQVADFIALVRAAYPTIRIGDIEPTPNLSNATILEFVDGLQALLRQRGVRGLDFLRVDVNWFAFRMGNAPPGSGWDAVHRLEAACHARGLPFSLIDWAADYPYLLRTGQATDETWENSIMDEGAAYAATGGVPDQFVIQSWVHTPAHAVPETARGTFMRSVLDFTSRFVPR